MKTSIKTTRETARLMRERYLQKANEVVSERYAYQQVMDEIKEAENEVVRDMFNIVRKLNYQNRRPATAREVYEAMGGDESSPMSYQEVISQLLVAANEHWNGSGRTHKARHAATQSIKDGKECTVSYKPITRRFVALNDDGTVGTQVIEMRSTVNSYTMKS